MFLQLEVPRISTLLKTPTKHISFRILTPHQMTFIRYIRPNIAENPHTIIWFRERSLQKVYPSAPKKPSKKHDGPVYVPAEVYKFLSPEAVVSFEKYNSESMNKMAKKRGSHVTDVTDVTDHELSIAETKISEEQTNSHQDDDACEGEVDPILDYINSQHHQEEDINNALQAYNIMTSPFSDATPQQSINSVNIHLFYHVVLLNQNQHNMVHLLIGEPMVDLQALMYQFSQKSSRKCSVTGIDQHQLHGLDIVQCSALVKTNHGYVNLIMNEYAYYGKGHTIHSSGQIESTPDGHSFLLKCTGGLMYLSIMGIPTDEEQLI